jgi:hypothetical protein
MRRTCGCNDETLIHAASARTTRVAAATAGGAGRSRAGLFASHGEAGQLLIQPFALTLGASGFLFAHYDGFKLVVALLADVFKNRHVSGSVKILKHH